MSNASSSLGRGRADARFAKLTREKEAVGATQAYVSERQATEEKTARLRALRLAKEAADAAESAAAAAAKPAAKKRAAARK